VAKENTHLKCKIFQNDSIMNGVKTFFALSLVHIPSHSGVNSFTNVLIELFDTNFMSTNLLTNLLTSNIWDF
jgi:hypothetical protein